MTAHTLRYHQPHAFDWPTVQHTFKTQLRMESVHLTQVRAAQLTLDRVEQLRGVRLRLAQSRLHHLPAPPLAALALACPARLHGAPVVDPGGCTVSNGHAA